MSPTSGRTSTVHSAIRQDRSEPRKAPGIMDEVNAAIR